MKVSSEIAWALALAVASMCALAGVRADDELTEVVLELIADTDPDIRALGFEQIRTEAAGEDATKKFAAALASVPEDAKPGLLAALAARGDRAARPEIVKVLIGAAPETRIAAVAALGALGDERDVKTLIESVSSDLPEERAAARKALVRLRGPKTSREIASAVEGLKPSVKTVLIEILADRRAAGEIPFLLNAAVGGDAGVRSAAMSALGKIGDREHLEGMARGVLEAEDGREREAAERAVAAVCRRLNSQGDRAMLEAIRPFSAEEQDALLPAIGRVGGDAALAHVEKAIADSSAGRREAGLRALCNWPDASVAPRLFELHENERDKQRRNMLLAALIRVAPLPDGRPDDERLRLVKAVMERCSDNDDRAALLRRTHAIRTIDMLRFLKPYMDQPAFDQVASESIVELAHHRGLREPNKAEFDAALDKVIATSKDPVVVERAQRYKKGQTWSRSSTAS